MMHPLMTRLVSDTPISYGHLKQAMYRLEQIMLQATTELADYDFRDEHQVVSHVQLASSYIDIDSFSYHHFATNKQICSRSRGYQGSFQHAELLDIPFASISYTHKKPNELFVVSVADVKRTTSLCTQLGQTDFIRYAHETPQFIQPNA